MDRFITKKLVAWRDRPNRKPLLIRGARQVGKTHSVIECGEFHEITFIFEASFEEFNPKGLKLDFIQKIH
jgi:predicted AAA+ superfamily ATPase